MAKFLIYGAYGYTGRLTARLAVDRGLSPVLAGRDEARLSRMADEFGLEFRAFDLDVASSIDRGLDGMDVVLHCAGPFSHTHRAMAEACFRTGTHYLDISGEIPVYHSLWEMNARAVESGVMLLPGIGFDVVPTDCLAAILKSRLPTATHLTLAIGSVGPAAVSRGTAKTFLEGLGRPGAARRKGEIVEVKNLSSSRMIDFGDGPVMAAQIVVADVFSAYHSTGIPNIDTYVAVPASLRILLKTLRPIGKALASGILHRLVKRIIDIGPAGPSDTDRSRTYSLAWAEVRDGDNEVLTARLRLREAYTFTALASLEAVERVMDGTAPPGYQTPSSAFGAGFALEIEGVELHIS